jgi:hypothetical protein
MIANPFVLGLYSATRGQLDKGLNMNLELMSWLGKEAARTVRKTTSQSKTVPVRSSEELDDAQDLLGQTPTTASQTPTRYGRRPYSRSIKETA